MRKEYLRKIDFNIHEEQRMLKYKKILLKNVINNYDILNDNKFLQQQIQNISNENGKNLILTRRGFIVINYTNYTLIFILFSSIMIFIIICIIYR